MSVAAHTAQHSEPVAHVLSQHAPVLFHIGPLPVSNSMLVSWIVTLVIVFMVRAAAGRVALVPAGMQNFLEFLIEGLYDMLAAILGKHLVHRTFWFFASIFLFILFSNWLSLVPLVGNLTVIPIGEGHGVHPVGLFRAANSDLNMPMALASIYGILWLYWAITENGVGGSLKHIFGAPVGSEGVMKILLPLIFFCVGLIEVISILFRQVSLPLRLYGNIFAGETLLETMTHIGTSMGPWGYILPLPFYFLEVLVALVQALVFMLLTSVFTTLMCQHEEGHGETGTESH